MQSEDAFTPSRTWALKKMNFAVKSGLRPSSGPFVLDSHGELRLLTAIFCMKINATILPLHFNPINIYLPWLIVKLVSFREAISGRNTAEARNCPNILQQLNDGIGS
jgi:hypothetical protein